MGTPTTYMRTRTNYMRTRTNCCDQGKEGKMSIIKTIIRILGSQSGGTVRSYGGHHKPAISDGLRRGSSEAAKIMAKWRWAKK